MKIGLIFINQHLNDRHCQRQWKRVVFATFICHMPFLRFFDSEVKRCIESSYFSLADCSLCHWMWCNFEIKNSIAEITGTKIKKFFFEHIFAIGGVDLHQTNAKWSFYRYYRNSAVQRKRVVLRYLYVCLSVTSVSFTYNNWNAVWTRKFMSYGYIATYTTTTEWQQGPT